MPRLAAASLAFVLAVVSTESIHAQNTAPYRDFQWPDTSAAQPTVLMEDGWFELIEFDGRGLDEIISFARSTYGRDWQKRVAEDMTALLTLMGHPTGATVSLGLRDTQTGETVSRTTVVMSARNRRELIVARRAREGSPLASAAVASSAPRLTESQITRDLQAFQTEIEGRWAYLRANGVDYEAAIARIRDRAIDGMELNDYGRQLHLLISRFIDGHARIGGFSFPAGSLPFLVESSGGRYVAVQRDRSAFLDAEYPYVTGIGGRPLSDWFAAVAPYVVRGSPQWVEKESLERIQQLWVTRDLLGISVDNGIQVDLASSDGNRTRRVVIDASIRGFLPPGWPATRSELLDGSVGYLRLTSMDDVAVSDVNTWMPRFQQTRGLIVDVRGNGGGSRDALRALFPYLMNDADAPHVVNASKQRLHPEYGASAMGGDRYMYLESWSGWSPQERAAIARFKGTFRSQWTPPANEFSDWFYLVMSRSMNPDAYFYDRPVIVLLDARSFSATDIFVSAFKGWRNVTLVGTLSGGGSALRQSVRLPVSGLTVELASMASFQANGRLYDGNGTQPDVLVQPNPEYYLIGGRDEVLERALALLRSAPEH